MVVVAVGRGGVVGRGGGEGEERCKVMMGDRRHYDRAWVARGVAGAWCLELHVCSPRRSAVFCPLSPAAAACVQARH